MEPSGPRRFVNGLRFDIGDRSTSLFCVSLLFSCSRYFLSLRFLKDQKIRVIQILKEKEEKL